MSFLELVEEAKRLHVSDQLRLVEELVRSLREKMFVLGRDTGEAVPMSTLRGTLTPADDVLPTDDEIDALIADDLLRRHA